MLPALIYAKAVFKGLNCGYHNKLTASWKETMGRYRPPRIRGSKYITAAGEKNLRDELRQLWKVERPRVTATVHEAAKNGDRSENGDYIYGKRRLREIDGRVRFLTKRLEEIKVVDRLPTEINKVFFGAHVTLKADSGEQRLYQIVGPDEFDLQVGKLSMDSPMAKALLGKRLDDDITFNSPSGDQYYNIVRIEYDNDH